MKFSSPHSLYTSDQWARLKAVLLLERGDICECGCGQHFKGSWDCIPHHKIELTDDNVNDASISLNPDNIVLLRHRCHNRVHERFGGGAYRKAYVVWGSPGAGKSSFVKDSARDDDLIIDMDRLWDAICLGGADNKPDKTKAEVFALRDCLLDRVRVRAGRWQTAWVIGMYPAIGERERIIKTLRGVGIHIDTPRDECLRRIGAEDERRSEWVEDYWRRYQPEKPPGLSEDD